VPEGEKGYNCTLSLTSVLDGDGWSTLRLGCFTPGKKAFTHYVGDCVGPRAYLDGCGKSRPNEIRCPNRPIRSGRIGYISNK
jgi:hypothetical protein